MMATLIILLIVIYGYVFFGWSMDAQWTPNVEHCYLLRLLLSLLLSCL